jgi:putative hemolysin
VVVSKLTSLDNLLINTGITLDVIWIEAILIGLLILANGFFACSEIAIIAVRRSRIKELIEQGDRRAQWVHQLQEDSERFIATIQIGVTVLSALAAAIGGVAAIESLKPLLDRIPFPALQSVSEAIAVGLVVVVISYLSLIIGELFPKSLALRYPERIALIVARPILLLSKFSSGLIRILTASSGLLMKPFGKPSSKERAGVNEEEIKIMIREGRAQGIFDQSEQDLIHSVFEFTDTFVKEVMVPGHKMHMIQIDMPIEEVLRYIAEHKFSRYPVYRKGINEIAGILYDKDLMGPLSRRESIVVKDLLHPPYFVPETMKVSHLLKELQRRWIQMAIVIDEYGGVHGLVTIEDLIEEIVGEIRDEADRIERPVERLRDGSWVVDASLTVRDLKDDYGLPITESPEYETLGGFVLARLQGMPRGGEIVQQGGYKFTVVDLEERRIAKVKIEKAVRVTEKMPSKR